MEFKYKVESNIEIGQTLYGIIATTMCTYGGVFPIVVDEIDYNEQEIIFKIDQPCKFVYCTFSQMNDLVFETENEANTKFTNTKFGYGEGMWAVVN